MGQNAVKRYLSAGACASALLLVACSPGAPPPAAPPATTTPTTVFYSGYGVTPTQAQIDAVRNNTQFQGIDGVIGRPIELKNYSLMGIDYAHAAGLKGAGQTIAVVDNGYHRTHPLLAAIGRTVTFYNNPDTQDHGTAVAAVAAGAQGTSAPMHGVAPLANLFLADWNGGLSGIATKFLAAKAAGAVVVNNSWGPTSVYTGKEIRTDEVQAYINGGQSLEQALQSASGWTNWADFLNASRSFGQTGIVVVAASNNQDGMFNYTPGASKSELLSSMPILSPDLADAWLKVVSFHYDVGTNGQGDNIVTNRYLASEACAGLAKECLALPSQFIVGPYSGSYPTISGTSFGAPMVSGMIAILAEAFPSLRPVELKERLLASADNSYFAAGEIIGTETFANAFTHNYSDKWGHGTPDVGAALRPIGKVAIVKGNNVQTGERYDAKSSSLRMSNAMGAQNTKALAQTKIAVFDDLNGNFETELGGLLAEADGEKQAKLAFSRVVRRSNSLAQSDWQSGVGLSGLDGFQLGLSEGSNKERRIGETHFGFARGLDGPLALQDLYARPHAFGQSYSLLGGVTDTSFAFADSALSPNTVWRTYGFAGSSVDQPNEVNFGVGGLVSHVISQNTELRLGGAIYHEPQGFAGMSGAGAFDQLSGSAFNIAQLGIRHALNEDIQLFADFEHAWSGDHGFGLLEVQNAQLSGFEIGLTAKDVIQNDTFTVSLAAPLAFNSGAITGSVVVGRTQDGNLIYEDIFAPLGITDRQLDLTATYVYQPNANTSYTVAGRYSLNAGHELGRREFNVLLGFQSQF